MRISFPKLAIPKRLSKKGDNGKLLIIAGGRTYHGAPALSILGARRFCDLIYFFPGEPSPGVLQSVFSIPEVILTNNLVDTDCVLYGPGLGNAKFSFSKLRHYSKKVIDGDGLKRVKKSDLKGAIITPHENEFREMFGTPSSPKNVVSFAKKYSCTILKKGPTDLISDGKRLIKNNTGNPGLTKGGTGDVLAGLTAALYTNNTSLIAAASAAYILGLTGDILYKKYRYAYSASDVAETLPHAYLQLLKKK